MIRIHKGANDKGLFVTIAPTHPIKVDLGFYRDCASEIERELLRLHLIK